jgi:hypothetical protein
MLAGVVVLEQQQAGRVAAAQERRGLVQQAP